MRYLFRNALAPNTHAAYNSGTTAFINFCLHYHRFSQQGSIIPATEDTLLLFVSYLSVKVRPSTIKVYLSAVRNLHIQHGFPNPVEHSILLPRLLRGVKRTYGVDQRPRLPITPSLLTSFRQHLNILWRDHLTVWVAMLVAFFAFLRSSELLALKRSDIAIVQSTHPSPIPTYTITLHASKTDPFRQGCTLRLAPSGHTCLCPAYALQTLLNHHHPLPDQPLFTLSSGSPLTRRTLNLTIKHLASYTGLNPSEYASHSFRIGAATTASSVGLPDSLIKSLGRWHSEAYQRYIRTPPTLLDNVPKELVSQQP